MTGVPPPGPRGLLMQQDVRPNPERSLTESRRSEARQNRGKLKVFFGMSAGVGKTYAMLEEARARAAEGLDVVVGYAEPHIRPDTEALLLGMEILPYHVVEYRADERVVIHRNRYYGGSRPHHVDGFQVQKN